jgi:hypothetical protein
MNRIMTEDRSSLKMSTVSDFMFSLQGPSIPMFRPEGFIETFPSSLIEDRETVGSFAPNLTAQQSDYLYHQTLPWQSMQPAGKRDKKNTLIQYIRVIMRWGPNLRECSSNILTMMIYRVLKPQYND